MKGHLFIHVGGYKYRYSHVYVAFGGGLVLPDRQVPAERHKPGTLAWYEDGWSVGNNSRDRFCKWGNRNKMRAFNDYDEAVAFIYRLRQKRKARHEDYQLVYIVTRQGVAHNHLVSSMDAIEAIDRQYDDEDRARETRHDEHFPEFDKLKEIYSLSMAATLSSMLADIRTKGLDAVAQGMSRSSFYRRLERLRKAGVY